MTRIALLLPLLMLIAPAQASEPNRPVAHVDLARYAGTWYEQAHLPMFFQRKCARDTVAQYTLRSDGRIDVVNRCTQTDGTVREARGVARRVGDSTSQLKVRFAPEWLGFLPFVWGDYWIVGLDDGYRWAMVGSPGRDYLWILSRERVLDVDTRNRLVERARSMGYPVGKLVFTPQG
ncbi:lipocalin family protein [Cognatilysobacter lacus]|uniref:Outer membrane lipoprotein Blc n=1 Tax=Cognatilysobacter lacus TaxID=1643323 RepID=A0A5D8Z6A7_9GAMM|nr:lipocalin family protein [Lysobacter lacus]TZF89622.1 lipocalin family protein [Lysobacter lacus]